MANINKIRLSGTSYDIQDLNATKVVNITQAAYDALPSSAKTANILYNITDAEAIDISEYWTSAETQSAITEATSGKVSTSDFNTYSGSVNTALNSKASQTDLNTLSGTVTSHTASTTIHVTAQDKTNWNNKSDFSGSYNDLTDKPTIPTVPTNVSDFTNDAGYITSSALDDYATTATTSAINNTLTGHTANTLIHVSAEQIAAWNAKSDFSGSYNDLTNKLSAGTNITIVDNVISAEGGGVNVVQTTGTSTADVMSQDAVTTQLNNKSNKTAAFGGYKFGSTNNAIYLQYTNVNNSNIGNSLYYPKINGKEILTTNNIYAQNNYNFQLVETSAITTAITSSSTDVQVPSAKAVNDKLGGLSIVKLTQAQYDALATKDSNTLYVING